MTLFLGQSRSTVRRGIRSIGSSPTDLYSLLAVSALDALLVQDAIVSQ